MLIFEKMMKDKDDNLLKDKKPNSPCGWKVIEEIACSQEDIDKPNYKKN